MTVLRLIVGMTIVFGLFACEKSNNTGTIKTIDEYLVKDNEISGWTLTGFNWIASTNQELNDKINGEGDLYVNNGFVEAAAKEYSGSVNSTKIYIKTFIYNFGKNSNCIAVFNNPAFRINGAVEVWSNGAGESAKYIKNSGLSIQMSFYRDKYLVIIDLTGSDSIESLAILKQFALNIDTKIKS